MKPNNTAQRNLAVMAKIAGVVKPSPVENNSIEKIDTGLGYLIILALLVAMLGIPAAIDGVQSISAYVQLAEKRTEYQKSYEARIAASTTYEEVAGQPHRFSQEPKVAELDTEAAISAAVAQEERLTQMIERNIETARMQLEAENQRRTFESQNRIEGWVTTSLQMERTETSFKNVLEARANKMAESMTEDEMKKARKLLEERRGK
jgi:hypothetical protein